MRTFFVQSPSFFALRRNTSFAVATRCVSHARAMQMNRTDLPTSASHFWQVTRTKRTRINKRLASLSQTHRNKLTLQLFLCFPHRRRCLQLEILNGICEKFLALCTPSQNTTNQRVVFVTITAWFENPTINRVQLIDVLRLSPQNVTNFLRSMPSERRFLFERGQPDYAFLLVSLSHKYCTNHRSICVQNERVHSMSSFFTY